MKPKEGQNPPILVEGLKSKILDDMGHIIEE